MSVLIHIVDIPILHADEDIPRGTGKWEGKMGVFSRPLETLGEG